jgi:hypothetical protein
MVIKDFGCHPLSHPQGDQNILVAIRHTHTIEWQLKFFGCPIGKARMNLIFPKTIAYVPPLLMTEKFQSSLNNGGMSNGN